MPVTARERQQLFLWFEEQMGKERAATMIELMPRSGADELVTKDYLDARLERMRSDLQRTLGTWIFASQAATIAAMGLLLGLTR